MDWAIMQDLEIAKKQSKEQKRRRVLTVMNQRLFGLVILPQGPFRLDGFPKQFGHFTCALWGEMNVVGTGQRGL